MSEPTLEQFQAAQAKEYSTYVAKEVIFLDGARAFNPGQPVPVSHVERFKYDEQGLVEKAKPAKTTPASPTTEKKD